MRDFLLNLFFRKYPKWVDKSKIDKNTDYDVIDEVPDVYEELLIGKSSIKLSMGLS